MSFLLEKNTNETDILTLRAGNNPDVSTNRDWENTEPATPEEMQG